MPIYVSGVSGGSAVPPGEYAAVCCDVVDLGLRETPYGEKRRVRVVWQLQDRPAITVSRTFNATLGPRASLRTFLELWRGRPFQDSEVVRFDLETVIGVAALLTITHVRDDRGIVRARVESARPYRTADGRLDPRAIPIDPSYRREPAAVPAAEPAHVDDDEDIAF